jgi:hypothetical protein
MGSSAGGLQLFINGPINPKINTDDIWRRVRWTWTLRPEYHRSARCMSCRLRRHVADVAPWPRQTAFCIWATEYLVENAFVNVRMTTRSLHIGINYPGTSCELHGCVNDAENLSECLIKREFVRPEHSVILREAKCSDIVSHIQSLQRIH